MVAYVAALQEASSYSCKLIDYEYKNKEMKQRNAMK